METNDLFEFSHEVHDSMKSSWKMVCERSHEVDIECDSIMVLRWNRIFRYEFSGTSLECDLYMLCYA